MGGGKSDFLLGDFAQDVPREWGPHWRGILFRKTYPELEDLITRSQEIYPPWFGGESNVRWRGDSKTWTWRNGATLKLRFLERDADWQKYWGHAYTWIGWDELGLYASNVPYLRLKARLRSAHQVPHKRVRSSANPGGAGHTWVKGYFGIDKNPLGMTAFEADDSGMRRMFIRSRLTDNKILLRNDPQYWNRLDGLGSPELVRALKEGDWNVIAGAFFAEFNYARHVIDPFTIPQHWVRLRAMDWGSSAPFCVGWYAVADGDSTIPSWNGWPGERIGQPLKIPRGALVKYREWYGAKEDKNGLKLAGSKLTNEVVADGILAREAGEKIDFSVLDPSAFSQYGGPSIAEQYAKRKVFFQKADNTRVAARGAIGGWSFVRGRLVGDLDELPMLYLTTACPDTIRTLPALQHDPNHVEDVDTKGEDHCLHGDTYVDTDRGPVRVRELPQNSHVRTVGGGLTPYRNPRRTRCDAALVRLDFEDGRSVTCTPDHLVMTTKGWISAKDLTDETSYNLAFSGVYRWKSWLLARLFRNSMGSGSIAAAPTSNVRDGGCTAWYGYTTMARFLRAFTSIIATTIALITSSEIWRCSTIASTSATTAENPGMDASPSARPLPPPRSGTPASQAASGTRNTTLSALRPCANRWLRSAARIAERLTRSMLFPRTSAGSVIPTARPVRCVRVEPLNERADVYCLTVPRTAAVSVEGGIIVHNCGDETRYACAARPWVRAAPSKPQVTFSQSTQLTINEIIAGRRRRRIEGR